MSIGFVVGFARAISHPPSRPPEALSGHAQDAITLLSIVMASAMCLFLARDNLKETLRQLIPDLTSGIRRPISLLVLLCLPLGLFGSLIWAATTPQMAKDALRDTSPLYWLVIAVPIVIIGPAAEEIFYRGHLWDRLGAVMPHWKAGTISAAFFLAVHVVNGLLAPLFVLPLAVILTVLRLRHAGLGVCIAAHCIYNGTIILGNVLQTYVWPLHVSS
ncbi:CPBP family intramembrane glutamic endopeptidase [Bradyrhizobium sp. HKCCYLS2038]|uniref:CPBP family intramembrane glutamic endopeptidase n=1 Tax=unclassified Bradyrhizobium TaxID=2631580 RepID=UPI003EB89AD6